MSLQYQTTWRLCICISHLALILFAVHSFFFFVCWELFGLTPLHWSGLVLKARYTFFTWLQARGLSYTPKYSSLCLNTLTQREWGCGLSPLLLHINLTLVSFWCPSLYCKLEKKPTVHKDNWNCCVQNYSLATTDYPKLMSWLKICQELTN